MQYGICNLSVVPMRKEPSDASEQVSQILFGELFEIISVERQWRLVKCVWDGYSGWIDEKVFQPVLFSELEKIKNSTAYSLEITSVIQGGTTAFPILMGSSLPNFQGLGFKLGKDRYTIQGQVFDKKTGLIPQSAFIERIAYRFLNAPYQWGGRSPFGIDCSGFTQMVYKCIGIPISRDASQQINHGTHIHFPSEANIGDLAFFDNAEGRIAHVGLLINEQTIIHAFGQVRVDSFDHQGIYNADLKKYTHSLRAIKRIL